MSWYYFKQGHGVCDIRELHALVLNNIMTCEIRELHALF
jgi:hypothetical protein